jgi:hypothetical protein
MPAVPLLGEEQCSGVGKFNRKLTVRQTSGTEAGTLLADVEFVHEELTLDDLKLIEGYLPGAIKAYEMAFGEDSDGRRPLEWKPKDGSCRMEFSISPGGRLLYGGRATIRKAVLRVVPKACVLTVVVRLEEFDPTQAPPILTSLGMLVDYQITAARLEGSSEDGRKGAEGGLPFGDYAFGPGDLVTLKDDRSAFVVSLGAGQAILRASLVDRANIVPFTAPASEVVTSIRLCGPKGGPASDALAKLAERCPGATPSDLLLAVLQCQGAGTTTLLEQGWTLTSDVSDALAEMVGTDMAPAEPPAEPAPPLDLDEDLTHDLPPDAGLDRGELLDPTA